MSKKLERLFEETYRAAWAEGVKAARAAVPTPMTVVQRANPFDDTSEVVESWHVPDGVCGFAWVNVKPGNSKFANWLKRKGLARKDSYYGGVTIWIHQYGQSLARKEAHARAFAAALREAGIKRAYAQSRMD